MLSFPRGCSFPALTLSLNPNLVQEGRLQVKELGHDVECEEVAVDPLSAHRCLQQSLVLIHRQAEQGKALWVLGSPGRSQIMEKQEVGLLLGPVTHPWPQPSLQHPCKAEIATLFYRGDSGSERGRRLPGSTQQGRTMGSQVRPTLLELLPVNRTGGGGEGDRGARGVPRELVEGT